MIANVVMGVFGNVIFNFPVPGGIVGPYPNMIPLLGTM